MATTACLTVVSVTVCLAVGIAVGLAVGQHGSTSPGLPQREQPGGGAIFVGCGVALLVGLAMRIGYVLYERRRDPDKTYRTKYERGLTAREYVGRLAWIMLLPAGLCVLGLLLRLQSG